MKREIVAGAVDQTIDVFIPDSSSLVGAGLTGLAFNTASLTCYYRKGATGSWTQLSLVTQTIGGAHADGGFVEGSAANAPGCYRLDLSDTMVATAGALVIMLKGATNMAPVLAEISVVAFNPLDGVRLGLTALPNAAAEAAGGLFTRGTGAGQINQPGNGRVDVNVVKIEETDPEDSAELASAITADIDANSTQLAAILGYTEDIGVAGSGLTEITTKLPAALVSGRIDASVGAMAANVMTAAAAAADLTTELQSGLATASALSTVSGKIDTIDDFLDTEIAAILAAVTALPSAAQNAAGLLDLANGVETGFTVRQTLRLLGAAAAGKVSGAGTTSVTIRNLADTLNRIAATVDADGNRSAVTHNLG